MSNSSTTRIKASVELRREFGERVLSHLAINNMNQSDLARRVGVSKDAVSTWCRGRSLPDNANILRLADVFSVDSTQLLPARFDEPSGSDSFKISLIDENTARIEMDKCLTYATALKIMDLVKADGTK